MGMLRCKTGMMPADEIEFAVSGLSQFWCEFIEEHSYPIVGTDFTWTRIKEWLYVIKIKTVSGEDDLLKKIRAYWSKRRVVTNRFFSVLFTTQKRLFTWCHRKPYFLIIFSPCKATILNYVFCNMQQRYIFYYNQPISVGLICGKYSSLISGQGRHDLCFNLYHFLSVFFIKCWGSFDIIHFWNLVKKSLTSFLKQNLYQIILQSRAAPPWRRQPIHLCGFWHTLMLYRTPRHSTFAYTDT